MIVDHRREQVVGGADRVNIAGEMQVDVLHRDRLSVTAPCRAAFDAKARAHARFAQAQHRLLADEVERIGEPDRGRRLAFASWGRRDRGDEDQLGVWPITQ